MSKPMLPVYYRLVPHQVASYLGVPPDNVWYAACLNGFLLFTALMLGVSIFFPSRLQVGKKSA